MTIYPFCSFLHIQISLAIKAALDQQSTYTVLVDQTQIIEMLKEMVPIVGWMCPVSFNKGVYLYIHIYSYSFILIFVPSVYSSLARTYSRCPKGNPTRPPRYPLLHCERSVQLPTASRTIRLCPKCVGIILPG